MPDLRARFSGSYAEDDIHFLLTPVQMDSTPLSEKEAAIQSGRKHYSDMLSAESAPDADYMAIYHDALTRGADRLATEVQALADALVQQMGRQITLLSLVRAGAPLGVLLQRALRQRGADTHHYGLSIIRDRGLDAAAMTAILQQHAPQSLVFVDGWTGKGSIATELRRSLQNWPAVPKRLVVLADPCGQASLAASEEDWLIPFGLLGATIAGGLSRSLYRPPERGFHGVRIEHALANEDISRSFADDISARMLDLPAAPLRWRAERACANRRHCTQLIDTLQQRYGIDNRHHIKPGLAEATRAVRRRLPDRVLLHDRHDPDLQALLHLCRQRQVRIEEHGAELAPYKAITLIRTLASGE